jgi:hypothetical protein
MDNERVNVADLIVGLTILWKHTVDPQIFADDGTVYVSGDFDLSETHVGLLEASMWAWDAEINCWMAVVQV